MEDISNMVENLFERTESYVKTSLELFKLKIVDKISDVVSTTISSLIIIPIIILFLIFLSIGIALWLGEMLNKMYYGFFIVAAFYAVAGIVSYFFMKKSIKNRINNSIINEML